MKIGIIKEHKIPVDHRVPFTPEQCQLLQTNFGVDISVEPSEIRCFSDAEYKEKDVTITEDLSDCDVLFGVKEVPIDELLPNKTYFFFSHTIKKQPYNRALLQAVLEKKVKLVDYECLKNFENNRIVAFGRWAGIVGAFNALRTYGLKYEKFILKPANECFDLNELIEEVQKIELPPLKICLTGKGRVANGAVEILQTIGVKNVDVKSYLNGEFDHPVYVQLDSEDYNINTEGVFDINDFYQNPSKYKSNFHRFLPITDMLIAGAYWDPNAPVLFTKEDLRSSNFNIKIIADITCDIEGSIPSTIRPSTISEPFYDIDRETNTEVLPFEDTENLSVMAVDNLPCELPRDASRDFGNQLIENITSFFQTGINDAVEKGAITTLDGELADEYQYLSNYVKGEE